MSDTFHAIDELYKRLYAYNDFEPLTMGHALEMLEIMRRILERTVK